MMRDNIRRHLMQLPPHARARETAKLLEAALSEIDVRDAALRRLLTFHNEDEFGSPLHREYWTPGYREAVEQAETLLAPNQNLTGG